MASNRIAQAASPNAPLATDGLQSALEHRFDLIDPTALFEMTHVLYHGAIKYGEGQKWRAIPVEQHLNHLIAHAYAWLSGDRSDDHLANMMCRAMFTKAVATDGE